MRLKRSISTAIAIAIAAFAMTSMSSADIVNIDEVNTRNAGPINGDVTFGAGFSANSHGNSPLTIAVTVANQDGDGDGSTDDSFTFDLTFATPNTNGVSLWGQGTNVSNNTGTNTSFGTLGDMTVSVSNVVGTNTAGEIFVFDGFTGAVLASGDGNATTPATHNRSIDFAGLTSTFDNTANTDVGFVFLQDRHDFAAVQTLTFDNQGVANDAFAADGTFVIRELDFQFSTVAVPEPSSLALLGLVGGLVTLRRRK